METKHTKPDTEKPRGRLRGEPEAEASADTAPASATPPDAAESAPGADPTAPKPETREEWKRRRAIALGVITA